MACERVPEAGQHFALKLKFKNGWPSPALIKCCLARVDEVLPILGAHVQWPAGAVVERGRPASRSHGMWWLAKVCHSRGRLTDRTLRSKSRSFSERAPRGRFCKVTPVQALSRFGWPESGIFACLRWVNKPLACLRSTTRRSASLRQPHTMVHLFAPA